MSGVGLEDMIPHELLTETSSTVADLRAKLESARAGEAAALEEVARLQEKIAALHRRAQAAESEDKRILESKWFVGDLARDVREQGIAEERARWEVRLKRLRECFAEVVEDTGDEDEDGVRCGLRDAISIMEER